MVAPALKWLPEIQRDDCTGCALCVAACDRACLELVWDFATLRRPADCGSCGDCSAVCPREIIRMNWLPAAGDPAVGRWREGAVASAVAPPRPRSWRERWF